MTKFGKKFKVKKKKKKRK